MTIKPANPNDVIRWPNGAWCYRHELPEMSHNGDDYEVLTEDHPEYELVTTEE